MALTCPSCGNEVPPRMPTCGWCGASLDVPAATPDGDETQARVFGAPSAAPLLVAGAAALAFAIFLLVTGSALLGAVLLIVGIVLVADVPGLARRPSESAAARRAVRSYDGLRERADATIEQLAARAQARRQLARIDGDIEQLEASRAEAIRRLGEAAYAREENESERLRGEIATADAALEAKRAEREDVLAETEERVDDAKLRAQPTERMEREGRDAEADVSSPDRSGL